MKIAGTIFKFGRHDFVTDKVPKENNSKKYKCKSYEACTLHVV